MQHKATKYPRAQHPEALNALLAHHTRIRQSGNRRSTDRGPKLHERVTQVPRKAAQCLPELRSPARHEERGRKEMKLFRETVPGNSLNIF